MTIDWKKEVEIRKEDLFKDLFDLLSIPSVREDDKATVDAPVGPGPKEALLHFLEIGERDGFTTKNIDNIAGHLEYGQGDETMGIFGHVDVVPVGTGWDTEPFKPVIKDGKLYARGASDDKGPSIAAYYALKMIKELELPVSKRVRFIIGTDEESSWQCMDRYLEVEDKPDFGFAPDAEFPIINGEKGNASINLLFDGSNEGDYKLISFESGLRANMVPESATALVEVATVDQAANFETEFMTFIEANPISGIIEVDGTAIKVIVKGKSAHGASPQSGINGGTYLAAFLDNYAFGGGAKAYLSAIATYVHGDTTGEKLGINYTDDVMGELTVNAGLFSFKANQTDNYVTLNIRYPKGITAPEMVASFEKLLGGLGTTFTIDKATLPHYVPEDDELVKTLLDVYTEHTGLEGHGQVIGGGTFGRLLERGVAYGAMFPHSVDTMHQANEFMEVDDIINATVIYADAIYRLIK
ncbi:dipeptidase PepV [Vagococcus intermedius]|uniref:Dipeptidase PepV n=1 Tax=Vagococcus intermedius TaxID=2991418 RepID=A0AAF0CUI8_9ENTE|nr:dipeptidase PepV [Vagococcus intermedius]WEG73248.1 dipeptidase PepV [Vagococcus intermedius]WEG75333.1 dipeptidase PepV [Vagococcus intermedius]